MERGGATTQVFVNQPLSLALCVKREENIIFKSRVIYLVLAFGTMLLGLASRNEGIALPNFLAIYAGDTLWALLVFWLVRALVPLAPVLHSVVTAVSFSYLIEFSQFYHAPWIDDIRSTVLGGLILGFGFKVSDLVCYSV